MGHQKRRGDQRTETAGDRCDETVQTGKWLPAGCRGCHGAGVGDKVLICRGNSARMVVGNGKTPVDAAIVGIIDTLDVTFQ